MRHLCNQQIYNPLLFFQLIIGNFGLSYEQCKTQMAMWAIWVLFEFFFTFAVFSICVANKYKTLYFEFPVLFQLIIGNFGLSYEQCKIQMTMWAIFAVPYLYKSCNLT